MSWAYGFNFWANRAPPDVLWIITDDHGYGDWDYP